MDAPTTQESGDAKQVERAWLAAGKAQDVQRMSELRARHPKWLALDRMAATRTVHTNRTSTWDDFHLGTIGASALHAATWSGSVPVVEFLLEAGQHPDTRDEWDMTPSMVAISRLYLVTMRSIFRGRRAFQRNLVVDCRDEDAKTVGKTLAIVELCRSHGGDLDAQSTEGKTALHFAAFDDAFDVAKHLLDAGAAIDTPDHSEQTALHLCVQSKSLMVTNLLLERGASIDLADASGASPLSLVVAGSLTLQLQLVLNQYALVSTVSRLDFAASVLLSAVDANATAVVSFLLENQYASATSSDKSGESAMHRAIVARNLPMMGLLHSLDADGVGIDARAKNGDSVFHYAARLARLAETAFLVDKYGPGLGGTRGRGPLNCVNDRGETALLAAGTAPCALELESERSATIAVLVRAGAKLFPPGSIRWQAFNEQDCVLFPPAARRCLCLWVAKRPASEVCYALVASVDWAFVSSKQQRRYGQRPQLSTRRVVTALLDVGFCHEALRLLALLPLQRAEVSSRLLPSLQAFARQEEHALLLQLAEGLRGTWGDQ